MGDVDVQTTPALEGEDGRYTAMVHQDWEIWGPCGGYVAAIALRAAGAESPFARPASFFCHYLSVAAFEPVDLVVTPLRSGRTVLAQRVHMTQHGRPVLEAMVWSVGEVAGLEHEDVIPPEVDDPDHVPVRTMGPPPGDEDPARPFASGTTSSSDHWNGSKTTTGRRPVRSRRRGGPGCATARPARWTTPGPTRPGWWSCSTSAAGRPAIAPTSTASRVHRTQPRPLRVVPGPPRLVRVAPARRPLSGGAGRPALVDRARVVRAALAAGERGRPGGVPPHVTARPTDGPHSAV